MKKIIILAMIGLALISCKKRKEITYPDSMFNYQNVLALETVEPFQNYSFGAKLGKKAKLKIVLTNLSAPAEMGQLPSGWFYSEEQGWAVSDYFSDGTRVFTSNKDGEIVLDMEFNGTGSCRIDFYENSSSISKTRILSW